ncbi:14-3-3 protein [Macroventuria anomochaeta]|uniref:14-3-3 protein n=1 Tax=Macroventuria anomochaeta TaxID=301207 RepID=A0ACB6SFV0_9PLEO|nr:14-3-3 protein [Macroventuria anomochaeta]KAF2632139.1 14-3-3 protein [Macroventuria anomochaeta]
MASLDFDQKSLGRIARQTEDSNPYLSGALYQILGLSVLLSRRLIRARKLRKLDTSRDTPSLAAYQHILWISREGLSILELYVLPYAQDNQHGPECRVLSVKLRASFYHIFCLFHNQPPVTTTNMESTESRAAGAPLSPRSGNGRKTEHGLSPPSKRNGKQPALREPIDSIVSETSFVTNPYAAGGPVGTPSPGPPLNAPPGLNPIPIPQPSSFLLPPLNFVPLATGYFTTATQYATSFLPGSHPLRLSVALEHSAFLWDCIHDHEGSRRVARRAIKDVYRAQEAMDDSEFEDAAELVGVLGRMMKRKSFETTPRMGSVGSPEPTAPSGAQIRTDHSRGDTHRGIPVIAPLQYSQNSRRAAEGPPITVSAPQSPPKDPTRSRTNSTSSKHKHTGSHENTPRSNTNRLSRGSHETTPRAKHVSMESSGSVTPRAPQDKGGRSPATPSTVRSVHQHTSSGGSHKADSEFRNSPPIPESAAVTAAYQNMKTSPTARQSPPLRRSPRSSPNLDARNREPS